MGARASLGSLRGNVQRTPLQGWCEGLFDSEWPPATRCRRFHSSYQINVGLERIWRSALDWYLPTK